MYFQKMDAKFNNVFRTLEEVYAYRPRLNNGVIESYNSIGIDDTYSFDTLLTPLGGITIRALYEKNPIMNNLIYKKLNITTTIERTSDEYDNYYGPYLSIMQNLSGEKMEHLKLLEQNLDEAQVEQIWFDIREIVFFTAKRSIENNLDLE